MVKFLWLDGLGVRDLWRDRLRSTPVSSDKLDCSDTPLSHVSYSASSDCEGDGDGHGELSSALAVWFVLTSFAFGGSVDMARLVSFSSSCSWSIKHRRNSCVSCCWNPRNMGWTIRMPYKMPLGMT